MRRRRSATDGVLRRQRRIRRGRIEAAVLGRREARTPRCGERAAETNRQIKVPQPLRTTRAGRSQHSKTRTHCICASRDAPLWRGWCCRTPTLHRRSFACARDQRRRHGAYPTVPGREQLADELLAVRRDAPGRRTPWSQQTRLVREPPRPTTTSTMFEQDTYSNITAPRPTRPGRWHPRPRDGTAKTHYRASARSRMRRPDDNFVM